MKKLITISLLFLAQYSIGQVIPQKITVLDAGGSGGSGNTKYVKKGYATKVDSAGNVYTVSVDTTLLKDSTFAKAPLKAIGDTLTLNTDTIPVRLNYYGVSTGMLSANSLIPKSYVDSNLALTTTLANKKTDTVQNIASLQAYTGNSNSLIVADTLQGGIFVKTATGTVDNGITFAANGGGYWVRQLTNKDIFTEWYGAKGDGANDDAPAINAAFANHAGYNILLRTGKTYMIRSSIYPSNGSHFIGNGGKIQRDTVPVLINVLSAITPSSSYTQTITVDTTSPSYVHLHVGQQMYFVNRAGNARKIETRTKTISNIASGGIITLNTTGTDTAWAANTAAMENSFQLISVPAGYTNTVISGITIDGAYPYYKAIPTLYWEIGASICIEGAGTNTKVQNCFIANSLNDAIDGGGVNTTISGNSMYWSGGSGVHLSASNGTVIDNNYIFDCNTNTTSGHNEAGIIFSNNIWNTVITNNVIDVTLAGIGAINSTDNSEIIIKGNTIRRYKTDGISIYCPTGNTIEDINVTHNYIYGDTAITSLQLQYLPIPTQAITYPTGNAIYFSSVGILRNVSITDNIIKSAPFSINNTLNLTVSANVITDQNTTLPVGSPSTLIDLSNSLGNFNNNTVYSVGSNIRATMFSTNSNGMLISKNNINTDKYLIEISSLKANFQNNYVSGNGYMRFVDSAIVKNNVFYGGRIYAGWSGYSNKGMIMDGNIAHELTIYSGDTNLVLKNNLITYALNDLGVTTFRSGNISNGIADSVWLKTTKDNTGNFVTISPTNALTYRTPSEVATDIGAVTLSANNNFTGTNTFSKNVQAGNGYSFLFGGTSTEITGAYSSNYMDFYTSSVKRLSLNSGHMLVNNPTDNGVDAFQVNGYAYSSGYKIPSGTSSQVLRADGSTTKQTSAQTTLVAGTKAITVAGVTSSSTATLGFVSLGGTVSTTWQYAVVCTANTVTITALTNTGATDTSDTSTLNYSVVY